MMGKFSNMALLQNECFDYMRFVKIINTFNLIKF